MKSNLFENHYVTVFVIPVGMKNRTNHRVAAMNKINSKIIKQLTLKNIFLLNSEISSFKQTK